MRWMVAALCLFFLYTGFRNVRFGDDNPGAKHLPVPRRLLGFVQFFIAVLLGGLIISLLAAQKT